MFRRFVNDNNKKQVFFDIVRKLLDCYYKIKKEQTIDCLLNDSTQDNDPVSLIKCLDGKYIEKIKRIINTDTKNCEFNKYQNFFVGSNIFILFFINFSLVIQYFFLDFVLCVL